MYIYIYICVCVCVCVCRYICATHANANDARLPPNKEDEPKVFQEEDEPEVFLLGKKTS